LAEDLSDTKARPAVTSGPHARRFGIAVGVLVVVLAAAAVLTWVLLGTDRKAPFSSFVPRSSDPVERSQQIADHVAGRYLTAPGQAPVVSVQAGEADTPALPLGDQVIALGTNPPGIVSYEYGDILFYRMCGGGTDCGLAPGDDPAVLAPILARESLELALYGFRYVKEATFVLVLLPPGFATSTTPSEVPKVVHFYRRTDLEDQTDRPVTETLADPAPTPATLSPQEAEAIESQTAGTRHSLQTGTDAANTLNVYALTPLPTSG
jgi:hypothetical protein